MQQPGIGLFRIRVVVYAAGKFLAGEHHGARLHAGAAGDGSLQLGGERRGVRAARRAVSARPAVSAPPAVPPPVGRGVKSTFPLWM